MIIWTDARRAGGDWQLVLLGEGDIPVRDGLRLLQQRGYQDFISVEWEKKWHPEIEEPEVAFPQHLAVLKTYVSELVRCHPEGGTTEGSVTLS